MSRAPVVQGTRPGLLLLSVVSAVLLGCVGCNSLTNLEKRPAPVVLFEDNFQEQNLGPQDLDAPDSAAVHLGRESGEYVIQQVQEHTNLAVATVPGKFDDSTLAVDVRLVGDTAGRFIDLVCRRSDLSFYRATIDPDRGLYWLTRSDGSGPPVLLTNAAVSAAIHRGNEANHLELTCAGSTISLSANDKSITTVHDEKYREGRLMIGAGVDYQQSGLADARLARVVVTKP